MAIRGVPHLSSYFFQYHPPKKTGFNKVLLFPSLLLSLHHFFPISPGDSPQLTAKTLREKANPQGFS